MLRDISSVAVFLKDTDLLILNEAGVAADYILVVFDLHHQRDLSQLIAKSV
jgi:hypothetical protein